MPSEPASQRLTGLAAIVTSAPGGQMRGQHFAEVHPVELVAGKDQHVFDSRLQDVAQVLAHGVGRALIPVVLVVGLVHRLLGGEDFDEAAAEIVEAIRAADVAVQARRLELREHVDLVDLAVDAVRDRNVDEPILAAPTAPPASRGTP